MVGREPVCVSRKPDVRLIATRPAYRPQEEEPAWKKLFSWRVGRRKTKCAVGSDGDAAARPTA